MEEKKNKLNFELLKLANIITLIDGDQDSTYPNYIPESLTDEEYLDKQIEITIDLVDRLTRIFKN